MTQQIRYYKQDGTEYDFSKTLKITITQTSNADMNIGVQKQKTAMQEAIEWVKVNDISLKVSLYNNELINKFNELLEKEKEQMLNFYMWMRMNENAEKYLDYSDEDMFKEYLNQDK